MMDELIFFDFCIALYYAFIKLLKRLARKTICFSKSILMHNIVIGHIH